MNPRRLLAVARKEFIHFMRDWRSLYLAIAIPILLLLLFGYALTMDLKNVPTVVWDQSHTKASRDFLSLLQGSPYFDLKEYYDSYRHLQHALDRGTAMIALVIPYDFADGIHAGREVEVQVVADGSDANTARLALAYTTSLGMIFTQQVSVRQIGLRAAGSQVVPVELVSRAWYNPDLRSQNTIVPGIIAVVMVVIAAMLTSITIAKEWELGTMEQLMSTPVRARELVFGKVIPYFVVGMVDVAIAVMMGQWLFDVPLRGNPGLLFAVSALFLSGILFYGMFLSCALKTQVLANQAALISGFLPALLLSGFVFAIENMPGPIQVLTYIFPARYFIALLRSIYMKGIGPEVMWLNAVLLTVFAAVMIVAANKRLKLKVE
jgi:ABC-2 type transport system permease protein